MNLIEIEDTLKGLPDEALFREAQMPGGQLPPFLVMSEIQRRTDMRKRFQAQQAPAAPPSVSQQILQEGIAAIAPPPAQGMGGAPSMNQSMQRFAEGGIVGLRRYAEGGQTSIPYRIGETLRHPTTWPRRYADLVQWELEQLGKVPGAGLTRDFTAGVANAWRGLGSGLASAGRELAAGFTGAPPPAAPYVIEPAPERSAMTQQAPANTVDPAMPNQRLPISGVPGVPDADIPAYLAPTNMGRQPTNADVEDYRKSLVSALQPATGGIADLLSQGQARMDSRIEQLLAVQPGTTGIDYLKSQMGQFPEQELNYQDLIAEQTRRADAALARSGERTAQMDEQSRKDAMNFALMQMGAGLASGKWGEGLAAAADTAMGVRLNAQDQIRQEERLAERNYQAALERGDELEIAQRQAQLEQARAKYGANIELAGALADAEIADANRRQELIAGIADMEGSMLDSRIRSQQVMGELALKAEQLLADRVQAEGANRRTVIQAAVDALDSYDFDTLIENGMLTDGEMITPEQLAGMKSQLLVQLVNMLGSTAGVSIRPEEAAGLLGIGASRPSTDAPDLSKYDR